MDAFFSCFVFIVDDRHLRFTLKVEPLRFLLPNMYIYNNTVYSIVSIYIIIIIIIIHIDIYANNFFYLYPQNRIWSITKITISSALY